MRAASACRKSTPAAAFSDRCLRNVCVQGRKLPARPASEGSVSPVGCCHRRWQSDPKVGSETSGGRGQRPPRRLSDRESRAIRMHFGGLRPSKPPGEGERNAFSPLFAPDNGGGPSGIGRGSAETGARRGPWPPLQPEGRLSWHGGKGRAVLARFRRGAGNGGILPQTGGVCNGEMRPGAACPPLQKNCASFPKKRLTKRGAYAMIINAA